MQLYITLIKQETFLLCLGQEMEQGWKTEVQRRGWDAERFTTSQHRAFLWFVGRYEQRPQVYCAGHGAHDVWHIKNVSEREALWTFQDNYYCCNSRSKIITKCDRNYFHVAAHFLKLHTFSTHCSINGRLHANRVGILFITKSELKVSNASVTKKYEILGKKVISRI